jgi:hypothetical protein
VTEYEELEETAAGIGWKRRLTSHARKTSPNVNPAKHTCWDLLRSVSTSEEASSPLPLTPIHLPMDSQLDSRTSSPLLVPLLAQVWLETDRQRSDPDGKWNKENKWARRVWDGQTLTSDEVGRWFEACGIEIRDV